MGVVLHFSFIVTIILTHWHPAIIQHIISVSGGLILMDMLQNTGLNHYSCISNDDLTSPYLFCPAFGSRLSSLLILFMQFLQVGRPVIYGLAAKGEDGVRRVLEMLKDELEITMALSGCSSVKDISRRHVRTERDRLQSML